MANLEDELSTSWVFHVCWVPKTNSRPVKQGRKKEDEPNPRHW